MSKLLHSEVSEILSMDRRKTLKTFAAASIASFLPPYVKARNHADVIVIGAGLSGLYSATILQDEGYKVTVLEADNRVGGRVFSQKNIPGNPETGGTAFGSGYARIIDISNRFNIKLNDLSPILPYFRKQELALDGELIQMSEWANHPKNVLPKAMKAMPPNALFHQLLGNNNPVKTPGEWINPKHFIHDISVHDWLIQQGYKQDFIDLVYNMNITHGYNAKDVSILMLMFVNAFASSQSRLGFRTSLSAEGGNVVIPEAMANSLEQQVLFNKSVNTIETHSNKAKVSCADGSVYEADHVICSLPFSVLKNIDISPSVQGPQAEAINNLRSQKINMLHVVPKAPFWENDGMSPNLYTNGLSGMMIANRHVNTPDQVDSFTIWLRGPIAEKLDRMNQQEARLSVIKSIEEIRPSTKNALEPVAYHSWFLSPFSMGDWAYWSPGQISKFGSSVGNQHGQIHFCGEHTAVSNRGMEGAMESGERVAFEIMGL